MTGATSSGFQWWQGMRFRDIVQRNQKLQRELDDLQRRVEALERDRQ